MSDKPSAAWYLAPIFLGIIGSAIMWYVLKDEDHPDSPKMVKKGWVIGIVLTLISIAWIPVMLLPMAFMGVDQQMGDHMQVIPEPVERMVPEPFEQEISEPFEQEISEPFEQQISEPFEDQISEPIQQQVPAPGFEDVPEMIVESDCDPSYPDVCIPPYPPDLNCGDISYRNFYVSSSDPHGFDGDKDGIGCES